MRYIKLSWYNSRWFDNYLNHWVQPDAIIPDPYNPLDWDRYAYCRKNPVNYTDPTGHFPWLLAVVGAVYVGYEVGVASGLLPDHQGIARAESAVGRYKAIEVTAGLAVQGQYAGPLDDLAGLRPGSSGYGLAQTNAEEINALGLSGSAYDPAVAAQVMQARIENAQAACHNCTAKDMLIVAALAQNKGISPTDLDGWSRTANGGGIAW